MTRYIARIQQHMSHLGDGTVLVWRGYGPWVSVSAANGYDVNVLRERMRFFFCWRAVRVGAKP